LPFKTILKVIGVEYAYKYVLPKKLEMLVDPVSSNIRIFGKILSGDLVPLGLFSVFIFIKLRYMRL
jgi:F0F1-type ATP synthase membrane subunit a